MEEYFASSCRNDEVEVVKDILKNNPTINVNWGDDETGFTAFHFACLHGHVDIIQILLAHPDVDVNHKSKYGRTPFLYLCSRGKTQIVRMMLGVARVMINEPDDNGWTPLAQAALQGRVEMIKWMIASGRDLDLGREDDGNSDVFGQARKGWNKDYSVSIIVPLLERFKHDPNKTRYETRKELGVMNQFVAEMFVLVVLHCDGYLEIKRNESQGNQEIKARRFFGIASHLPMELQKVICHRVFDSMEDGVSAADFEAAFKEVSKRIRKKY